MAPNVQHYIGRLAAWHNIGNVTGKHQTTEDLLADPKMNFRVFKSQLRDGRGQLIDAYGTFRYNWTDEQVCNRDGIVFLDTVGKDYEVIQHFGPIQVADALLQSVNGGHWETAGVLGKGETVFALADLGLGYNIGDDCHKTYLLVVTAHDGSRSVIWALCDERAVCANTIRVALAEKGLRTTIRHTKNAQKKVLDARETLLGIQGEVSTLAERMQLLASKRMNRETMVSILDRLYPKAKNDDGETKDSARRENVLADILRIYELNDGNQFPEQRGTSYNLLNAITNHTDHERSTRNDGRAESALFGSGERLKAQALELILESSKGLSEVVRKPVVYAGAGSTGSSMLDELCEATA